MRLLENSTARNDELEESHQQLQAQINSLQTELERCRKEAAQLSNKSIEVEELRSQLGVERERSAAQSVEIARYLDNIKESNQKFVDLVERNAVLDKLLQRQQEEKESRRS